MIIITAIIIGIGIGAYYLIKEDGIIHSLIKKREEKKQLKNLVILNIELKYIDDEFANNFIDESKNYQLANGKIYTGHYIKNKRQYYIKPDNLNKVYYK